MGGLGNLLRRYDLRLGYVTVEEYATLVCHGVAELNSMITAISCHGIKLTKYSSDVKTYVDIVKILDRRYVLTPIIWLCNLDYIHCMVYEKVLNLDEYINLYRDKFVINDKSGSAVLPGSRLQKLIREIINGFIHLLKEKIGNCEVYLEKSIVITRDGICKFARLNIPIDASKPMCVDQYLGSLRHLIDRNFPRVSCLRDFKEFITQPRSLDNCLEHPFLWTTDDRYTYLQRVQNLMFGQNTDGAYWEEHDLVRYMCNMYFHNLEDHDELDKVFASSFPGFLSVLYRSTGVLKAAPKKNRSSRTNHPTVQTRRR
ncbi:uncharacterized protein LOC122088908 isoform X3 [Macadamia integrifolia]|uniref:uncharacterized protein LOC122088908 isoform X3 n=1 Tax=Macadamia integrifolia TaxID=60698 RepID=UPI001C4F647D|nr:uncharacterized protein LOC122088908 isoform X3 [Macadamia integrifolia]XP_042514214.1 uncharacterized protein LOC122088908 isoform X3 [Macadamia integrifolia]